jgi:lysozyme
MDRAKLKRQLIQHEGKRNKPYRDTVGKLTIGVGRNLDDVGLRDDEIDLMLENDITAVWNALLRARPGIEQLDEVRQRVLADMAFNLGVHGLLAFTEMLRACQAGEYDRAAAEMLDSVWARQVPARAARLAKMMKTGEDACSD